MLGCAVATAVRSCVSVFYYVEACVRAYGGIKKFSSKTFRDRTVEVYISIYIVERAVELVRCCQPRVAKDA